MCTTKPSKHANSLVAFVSNFIFSYGKRTITLLFITEEILDSLRIKRGEDIDCDQSPEDPEKDKHEGENNSSKDAEKSREEAEDPSADKDADSKGLEEEPGHGKPEGKELLGSKEIFC